MFRLPILLVLATFLGGVASARTPLPYADSIVYNGRKLFVIPDSIVNGATDSFAAGSKLFVVIPQMADGLRADGKIWVVVAVLATIFAGLLAWLIRTDRKLSRLEKERRAS